MADQKGKRDRSPAFPQISLSEAVERLGAFERYFGRHPAPLKTAGAGWNLKQFGDILAALKHFGFIDYAGPPDNRTVVITEDGRNLLRAQQESVRQEIIRKAALKPKEIAKFWADWGTDRPPDPVCLDTLVLRNGYSQRGAPLFLRSYDATISFAGLGQTDRIPLDSAEGQDEPVEAAAEDQPPAIQRTARKSPPPARGAAIMEGERELTSGLLSKEANFRLIVSGTIGVKEIDTLIKKLQIDKDILADEAEEPPSC